MNMKRERGVVMAMTLIFLAAAAAATGSFVRRIGSEARQTLLQAQSQRAFHLADTGILRAIRDYEADDDVADGTFNLSQGQRLAGNLENVNVQLTFTPLGVDEIRVQSSATVGTQTRSVFARLLKNPPSKVFDYAYFVNNWGWFFGGGITAKGDVRSNGPFDFRRNPRVDGQITAGMEIDDGGEGIQGRGGEPENQFPFSPKLPMPNLQDLTYYENLSFQKNGTLSINNQVVIDHVFGDDPGETGSIVLVGTPSQPIDISGPVVIRGDVVIKGTVRGQGTIYAGRNIYVAGDVVYKNAPASPRPNNDDRASLDEWVIAQRDNDLVGFAARENIVIGDYTGATGGSWVANNYLFNMGNEDVGADGIPDTLDMGEGDGRFDPETEDLDGDGAFDTNYNWTHVQTAQPINQFANAPAGVTQFGQLATNRIGRMEGVFYTNHAVAGRVNQTNVVVNGSVISKDEAMIYSRNITFNYDERIHSRYRKDPNWLIDLGLPVSDKVEMVEWWE